MRRQTRLIALLGVSLLFAASCSSDGGSDGATGTASNIIDAGDVNIELPDDFELGGGDTTTFQINVTLPAGFAVPDDGDTTIQVNVELPAEFSTSNPVANASGGTAPPPAPAGGAVESAASVDDGDDTSSEGEPADEESEDDDDAIPLNEDDEPAISGLLDAFEVFNSCLEDEGVEFIGPPDPANPDSPTNDPSYLASLGQCAAESNILEAVQAAEAENASLTPEEIEARNEGYLVFEECLTGRGWDLGPPQPDQYGVLGPGQDGFNPPPGEEVLGNNDIRECASEATDFVASLEEEG